MNKFMPYKLHVFLFLIHATSQDQSISDLSSSGYEFVPSDPTYPSLRTFTTKKRFYCSAECNKRIDCRIYDYDSNTRQCRLWDVDTLTSGSIVASPSKPKSSVGSIRLSSSLYANIHNQSCDRCALSRYEICDTNTSRCVCPSKTYWNGSMCLSQLLRNQICSSNDVCRSDLNLTCQPSCDFTYRCSDLPAIGDGQTVVGSCNATVITSPIGVSGPFDIYVSPNDGTLYVNDWDLSTFQAYPPFSRTGQIIKSSGLQYALGIFVDNASTIYMVDRDKNNGLVYIQRSGVTIGTIPPSGSSPSSCLTTGIYHAYDIVVDRAGNAYIPLFDCYAVIKWPVNATSGVVVAGQLGSWGSTSTKLGYAGGIFLDEDRNALYVSDFYYNRIQRFTIGGNGSAITVAGNGTSGNALNQLNAPGGMCVTRDGQTLYVADYHNNRVVKWTIGATQGSVVAGDVNGASGNTSQRLNYPNDVSLDPTETYLYVSDYGNHRVQRFRLK